MRLEAAHETYPGIGLDAEVLFLLGITYLRIEEIELAREIFSELQMQHPDHHHGQQARLYLRYMTERYGPPDANRVRPDRSPPVPETPPQAKPEQFKDWRWRKEQRRLEREGKTGTETDAGTKVSPTEGKTPGESKTPSEGKAPSEGKTPSEGKAPSEGKTPGEGKAPGEGKTPGEGKDPSDPDADPSDPDADPSDPDEEPSDPDEEPDSKPEPDKGEPNE